MTRENLPSFKKPPVIETNFGVQFEPIPGFTNGHLGAFWAKVGGPEKWPHLTDAPMLHQEFERFGNERKLAQSDMIQITMGDNSSRLQFRNAASDRLVQLQNGRFIYNWLGSGDKEYARYRILRPEFDDLFSRFRDFLAECSLPNPQLNQWEITYTNHVPKGSVWTCPGDWSKVFNFGALPPAGLGNFALDSFGAQWIYEIPESRGRLRIQARHAWSAPSLEATEILVLSLTARGPIREGEGTGGSLAEGIELGHQAIVTTFKELTSADARSFWEEA